MVLFKELSDVETQIIKLEMFESLLKAVAHSVDQATPDETSNSLWQLVDIVESINQNMTNKFSELFDAVVGMSYNEEMEEVKNQYSQDKAAAELTDIISQWLQTK